MQPNEQMKLLRTKKRWVAINSKLHGCGVGIPNVICLKLKRGTYHDEPGACRPRSEEGKLSNNSAFIESE